MSCKGVAIGLALVLGLAMAASADDGFNGQWKITQEFQGQERVSTLTISENSGTWENQRGTSELSNVKVVNGKLTFSRTRSRQGQEFTTNFTATIVDGKLVGKMSTRRGDREFTAVRIAAAPSFIGQWDIELDFGGRQVQATLDIAKAGGVLSGKWTSQRGDAKLDKVAIKDDTLTFSRTMERQGQEFTIDYKATLVDGKLSGQMITQRGEMPFTGTAIAPPAEEDDEATALLKTMDANGDGKVSEDEASEGMRQFFDMIDADGDGGIDSTEMQTVVDYRRQQGR